MARTPRTVRVAISGESNAADSRPIPWMLAAIGGAIAAAVGSWALISGATVIAWLEAPESGFGSPMRLGTALWLLTNGGIAKIGSAQVTAVPLGLTAMVLIMVSGAAGYAAQQANEAGLLDTRLAWRLAGTFTTSYEVCLILGALSTNQLDGLPRAIVGGLLISGPVSLFTALRAAETDLRKSWPEWARAVPRAISAALLIVITGAGVALTSALLFSSSRVMSLHDSLAPGFFGGILLIVLQMAYLPNFLAWCASWVLGAGFSIGDGSVVTPTVTDIGMLPNIPAFAAVPQPGPGSWPMLWWLVTGVLAGGFAAFVVVRSRPRARYDETALVGGLSGVVAGWLVVLFCSLSNGSFGTGRLASIGVRVSVLAVIAPTLLGISGLIVGLILGLIRRAPSADGTGSGAAAEGPEAEDDAGGARPRAGAAKQVDPAQEDTVRVKRRG